MQHRTTRLLIGLALLAAVAACSPASAAPTGAPTVDEATATRMATDALAGLNDGNYAAWSRDWSEAMKGAIREQDFLAFRSNVLDGMGRFVAIERVERSSTKPGTYRYTFTVRFERATSAIAFGFVDGGSKIEGVFTN